MVRGILSILLFATALALPVAGQAKYLPLAPWVEHAVPRLHQHGLLLLVKQDRRKSRERDSDHNRARDAVSAGDVLPLQQIMQRLGRRYPGRLLDADLKQNRQGRWIYRLKLLAPGDQVHRLIVDAQSGRVLQSMRRE